MNKAELSEEVASETGLAKRTSAKTIDAVVSAISDCLAEGEKVTLVGFGTFGVRQRKARVGRSPQTGRAIQIPAKRVTKFLPGKTLRERVK